MKLFIENNWALVCAWVCAYEFCVAYPYVFIIHSNLPQSLCPQKSPLSAYSHYQGKIEGGKSGIVHRQHAKSITPPHVNPSDRDNNLTNPPHVSP